MADIKIEDLKPNSHTYKEKERLKAAVKKEDIVSTKKSTARKVVDQFIAEDSRRIKEWLFEDIIIPGIKNTILDMLQMMFFKEISPRRGGDRRRGYDDYSSYYGRSSRGSSRRDRDHYDDRDTKIKYDNIVLRNRDEAERVVDEMKERIRKCDSASVADLYDLLDLTGKYTDNNWGWTDERDIGIRRVSSGFLIDVAEPRYLD